MEDKVFFLFLKLEFPHQDNMSVLSIPHNIVKLMNVGVYVPIFFLFCAET